MKRVGSVVLLELCIASLILLMTGTIAVQLFVRADAMSRETSARTQAMLMAQSCAQYLASQDDMADALTADGYEKTADGAFEKAMNDEMDMRVSVLGTPYAGGTLREARIEVTQAGKTLFELPAASYYNKEVIHP